MNSENVNNLRLMLITSSGQICYIFFFRFAFFENEIAIIFLTSSLNTELGCSVKLSYLDGSFEYPQHMFKLKAKKIKF